MCVFVRERSTSTFKKERPPFCSLSRNDDDDGQNTGKTGCDYLIHENIFRRTFYVPTNAVCTFNPYMSEDFAFQHNFNVHSCSFFLFVCFFFFLAFCQSSLGNNISFKTNFVKSWRSTMLMRSLYEIVL